MKNLEDRVVDWIISRIGKANLASAERTMRLNEEAAELAQAEGISKDMLFRQIEHVYSRNPGDRFQEAGGVAVCLLGWCGSNGKKLQDIALAEIERIESKSVEQIRGSLARKTDSDLVLVVPFEDL